MARAELQIDRVEAPDQRVAQADEAVVRADGPEHRHRNDDPDADLPTHRVNRP
jgi:hypothetical protein